MSARIAPEPIGSGFSATGEYRSRAVAADARSSGRQQSPAQQSLSVPEPARPEAKALQEPILPPLPRPPAPPGAAFAVALISGQLPPRPTSERELQMRLGSADLPAQGSLALHDRRV